MIPRKRLGRPLKETADISRATKFRRKRAGISFETSEEYEEDRSDDVCLSEEIASIVDEAVEGSSETNRSPAPERIGVEWNVGASNLLNFEWEKDFDFEGVLSELHEDQPFIEYSFEELMELNFLDEDDDDDIDDLWFAYDFTEINQAPSSLQNLEKKLAVWRSNYGISETAMTALLHLFKEHESMEDFKNLNVDSRTLTRHTTVINSEGFLTLVNVAGGTYIHLGIEDQCKTLLDFSDEIFWDLVLQFYIDGLPLWKSSSHHVWPILCRIRSVTSLKYVVFPIGIWSGNLSKPTCPNEFLFEFVEELKLLLSNGFLYKGEHKDVALHSLIADAPAKSFLLNIAYFNGYSSCTKCDVHGEYDGRTYFPMLECEYATERTHESYVNLVDTQFHKSETILVDLPGINIPYHIPLDYMHLTNCGVQKTLLSLWVAGERPYKLSNELCNQISANLLGCRRLVPVDFQRKPRSLVELPRFKATELRLILFYIGPACVKQALSPAAYINFLCLHVAMRILADPRLCQDANFNTYAEKLLKKFLYQFGSIYDEKFITHNFHNLLHLPADVRNLGAIDEFSAFLSENYLGLLKKKIRRGDQTLEQFVNRYKAESVTMQKKIQQRRLQPEPEKCHVDGPLLSGCSDPQYKVLKFPSFQLKVSVSAADSYCFTHKNEILSIHNICWCERLQSLVVVCKEFLRPQDFFEIPCKSSLLNIFRVSLSRLSPLKYVPISSIAFKMFAVVYEADLLMYPILHSQL